jgi:intracellular sulfur oxidation DsrE/DsrF family protein
MMTKILAGCAMVLVLVFAALSQTPAGPKHHVVFQLTEPEGEDWGTLIIHVNNMRDAFAKDGGSEVEVVFFGPGLNMLRKTNSAYEERLKKLADSGVTLSACQNAMRIMNVKTEDLFPFASQVDSGVAELARKQEAGWAYIH